MALWSTWWMASPRSQVPFLAATSTLTDPGLGDITEASLKDRRILGDEGFISVFVGVDISEGKVVVGPEIHERGFAEDDEIFAEVLPRITEALTAAMKSGSDDPHSLQQVLRRVVGKWVAATHRRRPMIIPVVVEV